jgi:ribonucleoside-diphosphate reductase alpha chain
MSTHPIENNKPEPRAHKGATSKGLTFARYFTKPGRHPYDELTWEHRSAVINDERGQPVFEQHGIEVPQAWSQTATNIVASKYFRGQMGAPDRESSVRGLISRVVDTITAWAEKQAYFATPEDLANFSDELTHLLVQQKAAFNSPVWFNVGIEPHPQASACFINSVKDTMDSILGLAKTEGMLFKFGSGTGSNLSSIRSSKEPLAGGGTASGPVSFMRGYDAFAGVIKSGGKTRRAAKMVILNTDHPDITEFITSKADEERKAWALIDAGYDGSFNVRGGAYDSVFFQNANHSVRVTDEFMRSRHAVRHHHQRLAHLPEHGAHQRQQPVLGVHVPGRHRLQPGFAEPHEVREGGRRVRRGGLRRRLPDRDHGPGDPGRQRELPDGGHRPEQP